jgi:hypothetical protein
MTQGRQVSWCVPQAGFGLALPSPPDAFHDPPHHRDRGRPRGEVAMSALVAIAITAAKSAKN